MLEIKTYTRAEIMEELNIDAAVQNPKACIKGKLNRLGVDHDFEGRGAGMTINVKSLPDEFTIYCMDTFGCAPNTDFRKLRDVFYFTLNDDSGFLDVPNSEKMVFLENRGIRVNRGTIARYISKLESAGFLGGYECVYLVVSKDENRKPIHKVVSKELYCQGWNLYFKTKAETGGDYIYAYDKMYWFLNGHPLKHFKPLQNAFMSKEIERLQTLIYESYMKEMEN